MKLENSERVSFPLGVEQWSSLLPSGACFTTLDRRNARPYESTGATI